MKDCGSIWRRWDLHIHTKGTNKADNYTTIPDMQSYCKTLFQKAIEKGVYAIGITDYFSIDRYKKFLHDGRIEMHNNAVESMFRHIAMGRRNWLNSGSHEAAQNIVFMYSLYESCKMNGLDFGENIEDILTRMMNGDTDYMSMVPCNYTSEEKHESRAA